MELNDAFIIIEKSLAQINKELDFTKNKSDDLSLLFSGSKGAYKISFDKKSEIMSFEISTDGDTKNAEFSTISKSLFELNSYDERDAKSLANEISDELGTLFNNKKDVDLDKIKMPKAVSRAKAKSGAISYDTDSLANRFGALYPEFKDSIKLNIKQYGEFLPETFFNQEGTAKVLDVIANGTEAEQKKLFKMLNEVYEDGTNEVQDIIGVTILGAMKNDPKLMEVADKYMSDYMSGPIHEINKITQKNNRFTKKLLNPPAYKPKKKKKSFMDSSVLTQGRWLKKYEKV